MTFAEYREYRRNADNVAPLLAITAATGTGRRITCFSWRGSPECGIARAKAEAIEFGMTDLHDFRAE